MPQLPCETTSVSVDKSICEIRLYLEDMGVTDFMNSFSNGPNGREFRIAFKHDDIEYQFPVNLEWLEKYLERKHRGWDKDRIRKQAEQTACRHIKDQVKVLFAAVEMRLFSVTEVFQAFAMIQTKDGQYLRLGEIITAEGLKNNTLALPAPGGK